MGEPVKIIDLAHRMVELSGFRVKDENSPEGDIAIEVVGLRPGEKLYEELLIGNNPQTTQHPRIMKANEKFLPWSELQPMITTLRIAAVNGDVMMIRSMLQQLVPEYQPDQNVVDWVYTEQIAQADKLECLKLVVHSHFDMFTYKAIGGAAFVLSYAVLLSFCSQSLIWWVLV